MDASPPSRLSRARLLPRDLSLFALSLALFAVWPEIDLRVSAQAYSPEAGFYLNDLPWVEASYWLFARLQLVILPLLLIGLLLSFTRAKRALPARRSLLFLLAALLLGPGWVVNEALKNHWGRARPEQVMEFGGPQRFTPALQPADQCVKNCSFVSGHAALGFYTIALAWVVRRRRRLWLAVGIGVGALVGLGRLLQGGHFLGDVVFAFWATYFSCVLVAWWLNLPPREASVEEPPA